jgi:hypothetical protein
MWQDATDWAESEFRGAPGLGAKFQARLVHTAAVLARRPQGTLPQRFDWAELKGAYRLVHAVANPDAIQEVHRRRTRQRMDAVGTPVLCIHDTTALDFTHHHAVADQLGPIGKSADATRGLIQHNSLVVDPTAARILGLIHQQTLVRAPRPEGETRAARYRRADRESAVWTRGIAAVGRPDAGQLWVHVGDRGADYFGAMATARTWGTHFLFRLAYDRAASAESDDGDDRPTHLVQAVRRAEAITTATVEVARRGGRPARTARVKLSAVRLTIRAPRADVLWRNEPPITLSVVRIWEEEAPQGVEPLEWILGTDLEDVSAEALVQYQSWYEWRWRAMEEYHKVQKTGCRIEDVRFETVERLQVAIALLSVVAVRVLQMRWAWGSDPGAAASAIASAVELEAVASIRRPPIRTVKDFVSRVAGLGGYLGRKCDGPPGWQSLWRGYQRLADILLGYELAKRTSPPKPPDCG